MKLVSSAKRIGIDLSHTFLDRSFIYILETIMAQVLSPAGHHAELFPWGPVVIYNRDFTFLLSVYIFTFIVGGEQKTFIYKEMRSP